MQVTKRKDSAQSARAFMHILADLRGGVTVKTSELGGDFIEEATPLGATVSGQASVVKFARVNAIVAADGVAIPVDKGHHFKVGDFVMKAAGAKAYAITEIDKTNATKDTITIGTAVGAFAVGDFIMQAAAEAANNTSALKVSPVSLVGTSGQIKANDTFTTDAVLIGVLNSHVLIPSEILTALKGIVKP